jgi:Methyltransferase domain
MMMTKEWEITYPNFEYTELFKDNATPWAGHKCFGYNLIKNLQPGLVVELGSWKGTSFYSFCQAAKDYKLNSRLVAIDTWQGDTQAGMFGDEVFNHFKQLLSKCYGGVNANFLRKTFDEAVNEFADQSIDVLHIDGFHTYDAVSYDFNTWKGKVKKTGVILFHDIKEQKDDFGVYRFWAEIKERYKNCLEFSHSHGLGILILDDGLYNHMAQHFVRDRIKCLQYSYQSTKHELFEANYAIRELADIKASKFWKLKEGAKKLLGR